MPSTIYPDLPRPLLFGHRGASRHAPENTLEAFDLAARQGANVLEMDVHMTADGEVVVLHDAELARTTDGHGEVSTHTFAQLCALDAGARFVDPNGTRSFVGRGCKIPRLIDVLRAFPKLGHNIEVKQGKPAMVAAVLRVLEAAGPANVLLSAGHHPVMQQLEAARPGCPLGLSGTQAWKAFWTRFWGRLPAAWRGRALQVPPRWHGLPVLNRKTVQRAHAAGLQVHVWTLNTLDEARHWLAQGVDGIMSDDPAAVLPAFTDRQAPLQDNGVTRRQHARP
jgi:glycerophosphoryl diester phosphodiesterase